MTIMKSKYHDEEEKDLFEDIEAANKKIRKKIGFLKPQQFKNNKGPSYENVIFLIICFIMSGIVFFSIGVEKGRHDVDGVKKERKEQAVIDKIQEVNIGEQKIENETRDIYAIQLVAFKTKGSAENEIDKLKKQGYNVDMRKSGDYYQVYIGGFENKVSAQKIMGELKKEFKDCYIKKL